MPQSAAKVRGNSRADVAREMPGCLFDIALLAVTNASSPQLVLLDEKAATSICATPNAGGMMRPSKAIHMAGQSQTRGAGGRAKVRGAFSRQR